MWCLKAYFALVICFQLHKSDLCVKMTNVAFFLAPSHLSGMYIELRPKRCPLLYVKFLFLINAVLVNYVDGEPSVNHIYFKESWLKFQMEACRDYLLIHQLNRPRKNPGSVKQYAKQQLLHLRLQSYTQLVQAIVLIRCIHSSAVWCPYLCPGSVLLMTSYLRWESICYKCRNDVITSIGDLTHNYVE